MTVTQLELKSFEIIPVDEVDPDILEVRFEDFEGNRTYVLFDGANEYPTMYGGSKRIPRSEDFLEQFAAYLGYRVVKD